MWIPAGLVVADTALHVGPRDAAGDAANGVYTVEGAEALALLALHVGATLRTPRCQPLVDEQRRSYDRYRRPCPELRHHGPQQIDSDKQRHDVQVDLLARGHTVSIGYNVGHAQYELPRGMVNPLIATL